MVEPEIGTVTIGWLLDGDISPVALHEWRVSLGSTSACAGRLLQERRPAWPTLAGAPNGLVIHAVRRPGSCDCAQYGLLIDENGCVQPCYIEEIVDASIRKSMSSYTVGPDNLSRVMHLALMDGLTAVRPLIEAKVRRAYDA